MGLALRDWIEHHEGLRQDLYQDTEGKYTIGIGRNLSDNGISIEEAHFLLENDIASCQRDLEKFSWYTSAPRGVQDALTNMCFNLGLTRLLGFKRMIAALKIGDYRKAACEALDSKWARQVGLRAYDVADVIRAGQ